MGFAGFTRRMQRGGAWFDRAAFSGGGAKYAPLVIKSQSVAPTDTTAGAMYVNSSGQLVVSNGTNYVSPAGDTLTRVSVPNAAAAIDQWAFVADRACQLIAVKSIFTVTNGAAFTVDVKKASGTTAPASGTTMLTAAMDWNTTANTLITATITATPANALLAANDRIALDFTGTATSIAGGLVILTLRAV